MPRNIKNISARMLKKIIKLIPEILKKEKYFMIKMDLCLQKCKSDSIFQNQTMYFFTLIEHIEENLFVSMMQKHYFTNNDLFLIKS